MAERDRLGMAPTELRPPPQRLPILRAIGSWPVGEVLELYVYANGRKLDASGREMDELKVPFKLTAEMCVPGCARDMITVAISDTTIEVDGAPLQAAGLKYGIEEKRK